MVTWRTTRTHKSSCVQCTRRSRMYSYSVRYCAPEADEASLQCFSIWSFIVELMTCTMMRYIWVDLSRVNVYVCDDVESIAFSAVHPILMCDNTVNLMLCSAQWPYWSRVIQIHSAVYTIRGTGHFIRGAVPSIRDTVDNVTMGAMMLYCISA